jgi:hypothetical protein
MRRRSRPWAVSVQADNFHGVVLDRGHALLFLRIPPFVRDDAVPARVGSSEKSGVTRGGAGVGVIVIAVGEISSVIEKKAEASFAKPVAIAFQVIAAKLINHDDDNQLGPRVVGGRERGRHRPR